MRKEMKTRLYFLFVLIGGWQAIQAQSMSMYKALNDSAYQTSTTYRTSNKLRNMEKVMKFCQSCGMPLTEDVLGTNADGSKNEDYCMYCYKDGKFLQDCTMDHVLPVDHINVRIGMQRRQPLLAGS